MIPENEVKNERTIDPISLEVVRGRLQTISDEMLNGMVRASFSDVIKETADCSTAIFDVHGQCVAQSSGIPLLLGTLFSSMSEILKDYPPSVMKPGDVYGANDPYRGGTHIPDLTLFSPVFAENRVVGFSVSIAHHRDVGGRTPGSCPVDSTEIFQEGIRIPPVKFVAEGVPNEALFKVFTANSRLPEMILGDLAAQMGACRIGEERMAELVAEYGIDACLDMFAELMDRSERMTRDGISRIPPGRYEFEDFLDNDGVDLDRLIPIKVAVTVEKESVTIDFSGSSPQVRGPVNTPSSVTVAASFYVVRCVTGANIASNSGCLRPIKIITEKGSVVNPNYPAPVNARSIMYCLIVDVLFGAFAKAVPGKLAAIGYDFPLVHIGGRDDDGEAFVFSEIGTGGFGARPNKDGIEVYRSKIGKTLSLPVESSEMSFPIRVEQIAVRQDSGGPGRYRGGLGYSKIYRMLVDDVTISMRGDRHRTAPWGLEGGEAAEPCVTTVLGNDGSVINIPSKKVFRLNRGDRLVLHSAGGGGYGNPLDREAGAVHSDFLDGKISRDHAKRRYGIVINDDGAMLNPQANHDERALVRGQSTI